MSNDDNAVNIIDEILSATTHYQVLGVDDNDDMMMMDTTMLRKAYLRRSVKVHPDKNHHQGATEAFQRVAAAWQVLSDDTSRAQYDAALQQGRGNLNDNHDDTHDDSAKYHQQQRQPSMQEALFVFATVVGSMMGGKTMANLTEALFWGEKLMRQQQQQQQRDVDANNNLSNASEKATMAMALGSGLKVASTAAKSLGMSGASQKLEQSARLAQMAGVGLFVADQPAVKRVLESESLRKLKGSVAAVRTVWNQVQQTQSDSANAQGRK